MGVFVGGTEIPDDGVIQVGGQQVQSIFVGRTQVWPPNLIVGTERVVQDLEQRVVQDGVDIRVVQQSSPTVGGHILQEDGVSKILLEDLSGFLLLEGQVPTVPGVSINPGDDWQTIIDGEPAGTTYVVEAGVHVQQSARPKQGDTFTFRNNAVMRGSRVLTGWIVDGSNWSVTGISDGGVFHHPPTQYEDNDPVDGKDYTGAGDGNNELFSTTAGVVTRHRRATGLADMDAESWWYDTGPGTVYIGFDPATVDEIRFSDTQFAIFGTVDDITINSPVGERGTITEYANPGSHGAIHPTDSPFGWETPESPASTGNNWLIQNMTVSYCYGSGIFLAFNSRATENLITRMGEDGLHTVAYEFNTVPITTGIRVDHNEISYNNETRGYRFWKGGGCKMVGSQNMEFDHNWVHHNLQAGIWFDIANGGSQTKIHHNLVEDNALHGIFWEISWDVGDGTDTTGIFQNLVRRNGWKFDIAGGGSAAIAVKSCYGGAVQDIHNNVIEVNEDAVGVPYGANGRGPDGIMIISDSRVINDGNVRFRNNKVKWSFRNLPPRAAGNGLTSNNGGLSLLNSTWQNNEYVYVGPSSDFTHRFADGGGGFDSVAMTFANWQAEGYDLTSTMAFNTTPIPNTIPSGIPTWTDVFDGEV